ncbi:hypothetical protein HDU97_005768 [Phlyctochytrium planicorne]|nr:hypothetical protein HDU97_005768 [Phlyctochytrium planicorne]
MLLFTTLTASAMLLSVSQGTIAAPSYTFAAPQPFKDLVIFGDSYSDTFNTFNLTGKTIPNPNNYFQGRSSNGIIWDEQLAAYFGARLRMYAYAASVSNQTMLPPNANPFVFRVPDLPKQVDAFAKDEAVRKELDPQTTLYSVFIGGNDYIAASATGTMPNPAGVVSTIINEMTRLIDETNAKFISTWTIGNYVPPIMQLFIAANPAAAEANKALTNEHNRLLKEGLAKLKSTKNVTIFLTDLTDLFQTEASKYNITVTDKACIILPPVVVPPNTNNTTPAPATAPANVTVCSNPGNYLFWDDIHPTTVGHSILGNATLKTIEGALKVNSVTSGAYRSTAGWLFGGIFSRK